MKIRIEPTEWQVNKIECQNPKIEVWLAGDDHNLQEVIDYLVTPALKAFGYEISEGQISVGKSESQKVKSQLENLIRKHKQTRITKTK